MELQTRLPAKQHAIFIVVLVLTYSSFCSVTWLQGMPEGLEAVQLFTCPKVPRVGLIHFSLSLIRGNISTIPIHIVRQTG